MYSEIYTFHNEFFHENLSDLSILCVLSNWTKRIGDPLYIGMDLTIASFDSISEVNMVSCINIYFLRTEPLVNHHLLTEWRWNVDEDVLQKASLSLSMYEIKTNIFLFVMFSFS